MEIKPFFIYYIFQDLDIFSNLKKYCSFLIQGHCFCFRGHLRVKYIGGSGVTYGSGWVNKVDIFPWRSIVNQMGFITINWFGAHQITTFSSFRWLTEFIFHNCHGEIWTQISGLIAWWFNCCATILHCAS